LPNAIIDITTGHIRVLYSDGITATLTGDQDIETRRLIERAILLSRVSDLRKLLQSLSAFGGMLTAAAGYSQDRELIAGLVDEANVLLILTEQSSD
jgi:hypothetical protein